MASSTMGSPWEILKIRRLLRWLGEKDRSHMNEYQAGTATIARAQSVLLGVFLVATQSMYLVSWFTGTTETLTNVGENSPYFPGKQGSAAPNIFVSLLPLCTLGLIAGSLVGSRGSKVPGRWLAALGLPLAVTPVLWYFGLPQALSPEVTGSLLLSFFLMTIFINTKAALLVSIIAGAGAMTIAPTGGIASLVFGLACRAPIQSAFKKTEAALKRRLQEMEKSLVILSDILPPDVASQVVSDPASVVGKASIVPRCTLVFLDLKNYTKLSARLGCQRSHITLYRLQEAYDTLGLIHSALKLESVGDATEYIFNDKYMDIVGHQYTGMLAEDSDAIMGSPVKAFDASRGSSVADSKEMEDFASGPTSDSPRQATFPGFDSPGAIGFTAGSTTPTGDGSQSKGESYVDGPGSVAIPDNSLIAGEQRHSRDNIYMGDTNSKVHALVTREELRSVHGAIELGLDLVLATEILGKKLSSSLRAKEAKPNNQDSISGKVSLSARVGVASGQTTAGVTGSKRPHFLVLGGAASKALFLESSGRPGGVHMCSKTFQIWKKVDPSNEAKVRFCTPESCRHCAQEISDGFQEGGMLGNSPCCWVDFTCIPVSDQRRKRVEKVCSSSGKSRISKKMMALLRKSRSDSASVNGEATSQTSGSGCSSVGGGSFTDAATATTSSAAVPSGRGNSVSPSMKAATHPKYHPLRLLRRFLTPLGQETTHPVTYALSRDVLLVLCYAVVPGLLYGVIAYMRAEDTLISRMIPYFIWVFALLFLAVAQYYARRHRHNMAFYSIGVFALCVINIPEIYRSRSGIADPIAPENHLFLILFLAVGGCFMAEPKACIKWYTFEFVFAVVSVSLFSHHKVTSSELVGSILARALAVAGSYYLTKDRLKRAAVIDDYTEKKNNLDALLDRLLPSSVLEVMLDNPGAFVSEYKQDVTVLFLSIDISPWMAAHGPGWTLARLSNIWETMDDLCTEAGCRPIETVRGEYMVATYDSDHTGNDGGVSQMLGLALSMGRSLRLMTAESKSQGVDFTYKIGVHYGDSTAGPVGSVKRAFKHSGDTINTCARYTSHAAPCTIHCSQSVADQGTSQGYSFLKNADVAMKGKGELPSYTLQ